MRRRTFLRGAAAGGAGVLLLRDARSAWSFAANEKVRVALVGLSGRGSWFVQTMPKLSQVVALCDVNDQKAEEAYKQMPDLPRFKDFRKMLDAKKEIEAVVVAVPDHMHVPISVAAMRHGKGVYVEKPMAHNPYEARLMRQVAREQKVATQMGNQGTASAGFRRALELLRADAIGGVKEVHVWKDNGGAGDRKAPEGTDPVPKYLDWDLWLGPAAERPFNRQWMRWHTWRDFATGNLGNWGSHSANVFFMALDLPLLWHAKPVPDPHPVLRIEAKVSGIHTLTFPRWEVISYSVPARGKRPPVPVTWHNGNAPGSRDRLTELISDGGKKAKLEHAGVVFVGSKGRLVSNGHNTVFRLLPETDYKDVQCTRPETVERSRGHEKEWLIACQGGKPAWSNFDYSGPLEEFLMLGNVATRFEGPLDYDPVDGKIVNNAAADRALKRDYRKGWEL
jgi:hypothetical protein